MVNESLFNRMVFDARPGLTITLDAMGAVHEKGMGEIARGLGDLSDAIREGH